MTSLVEWLQSVFYGIAQRAAQKKVSEIAATLAVRQSILREQARLRVEEYQRHRRIELDKALGIRQRVLDELAHRFDLLVIDPECESVRDAVAVLVTKRAVDLSSRVAVDQLARAGEFDPKCNVMVKFRDSRGATSDNRCMILSLRDQFVFHDLLVMNDVKCARIEPSIALLARERLTEDPVDIIGSRLMPGRS